MDAISRGFFTHSENDNAVSPPLNPSPFSPMRLKSPLTVVLALLGAALLPAATTIVRGPYLQTATPTSMIVRWRTDLTERSVVSYGETRGALTSSATSRGVGTEHIVQLTDLKPN